MVYAFRVHSRALIITLLLCCGASDAQNARPTLVVQITMDQLRGDLLRDYAPALTRGFRRLESGGYWFRRGNVDHALTVSFPGHATLATGMHPAHHGLTANEWWLNRNGKWREVDVVEDADVKIVGSAASRHGSSPKMLLASTLGEWVKQASPSAKSIAIGTGTTIPIAYAGRHSDGAYWFDSAIDQFTTSSFYRNALPEWVKNFNHQRLASYEHGVWSLTVPADYVHLAAANRQSFNHSNGVMTFPHTFEKETRAADGRPITLARWFAGTPLKDEALFALATEAIAAEKLGQRGVMDYLAIDVDSTDSVGHEYGPRSLEQLDALVRLDRALGKFLESLDRALGKGNYSVVLAADHGVADPPESHAGGRRVHMAEIESLLDDLEQVAKNSTLAPDELSRSIVAELKKADFIAEAYTEQDMSRPSNDKFIELYKHCFRAGFVTDFPLWSDKPREFHPARYGIVARFTEGTVFDAAVGVHGSPYAYDRDVPIIFYGAGVKHGTGEGGARTVDVAPTIAAAADIPVPAGLDGRILGVVLAARRAENIHK